MDKDFDRPASVTPAPAIGYSITATLGDRRQIVVQCFVGEDEADTVVNAKVDRVMRVIDRQQAFYDIDAQLEGFHKVGSSLRQLIDGLPIAEKNYQAQRAQLTAELEAKQETRAAEFEEGYSEFTQGGRKGEYKPKGHREANLRRHDADIQLTREKIEKMPADRAQARGELFNSIRHYQADLKTRRAAVNALAAKIGRDAITDYEEAESFVIPEEGKG